MPVLLREYLDEGQLCLVTLNRPQVLNAFNTELGKALLATFREIAEDQKVRAVIVTGSGDRAFSTGGDLKERRGMSDEDWQRQHQIFEEAHRVIRHCHKPVISAVNGLALGGGCELAMCGDFIYASTIARFGLPEVTRGIIPGIGGTQLIGRGLPKGVALEMLLTGRSIDAKEAYLRGLVNRLVPPDDLLIESLATARAIAENSPLAVRMAKKSFCLGADISLEDAIEFSLECYYRTVTHPDRTEGVLAFNERRKPRFQDIY